MSGIIRRVFDKHHKINCATCGTSDLAHSIEMELLEKELVEEIKKAANYDGDIWTQKLLGEHFDRRDYHDLTDKEKVKR